MLSEIQPLTVPNSGTEGRISGALTIYAAGQDSPSLRLRGQGVGSAGRGVPAFVVVRRPARTGWL